MPTSEITPSTTTTPGRCPLCNAPLQNPHECPMCDWVPGYETRDEPARRNPRDAIAAILSVMWPGVGQFYKGHTTFGAALALGGLICLLWSVAFFMFFGFLILPVYWLWVAVDAFFRKDLKFPQESPGYAVK